MCWHDSSSPTCQLGRPHGWTEVVALSEIAAEARQDLERGPILHALGNDAQAQVVSHVDDGPDDRPRTRIGSHVSHERAVDFQLVDRQVLEVSQ